MSLINLTRDVLGLWWVLRVNGRRSAPGVWTVRRSVEKMTRDDFASGGLHDVKGGRSAPQTLSLSRDVVSLSVRSV